MKKFLKVCLCFVVALSVGLIFAGCKNKNPETEDNSPAAKDISVVVSCDETATAYGSLPTISATATCDGNTVSGTVSWDDGQIVTIDKTSYSWTFTPDDTTKYNSASGTKTLTVNKATATANLRVDVDINKQLDNNTLTFMAFDKVVEGTILWQSVQFDATKVGKAEMTNIEVDFTFNPTDQNFESVSGKALITPKFKPEPKQLPPVLSVGTQMSNLSKDLESTFYYKSNKSVYGTCVVDETTLVPGKNTISYTFTPEDTASYLTINDSFETIAFISENSTYLIENTDQLFAIANTYKSFNESSFKLANDLDLSDINFSSLGVAVGNVPHLAIIDGNFEGTFDGDGHKIYGIDAVSLNTRIALFKTITSTNNLAIEEPSTNAVVKNLILEAKGEFVLCAYVKGSSLTTLENITISGSVLNAGTTYAPLVTFVEGQSMLMLNGCTNNYKISGLGTVSAFIACLRVSNASNGIIYKNCINNAEIMGQYVGMFLAEGSENGITYLNGNTNDQIYNINNGKITALNYASLFGYGDDRYLTSTEEIDPMFKNNGLVTIINNSQMVHAEFGDNGLECTNIADGTSYARVFAVVSCYRNGYSLSTTIFEELDKKNVNGTSINFENVAHAEYYIRKTSSTEPFLSYQASDGENPIVLVNFGAIKGLSTAENNSDWRVYEDIVLVVVCYDAENNIVSVSDNPVLASPKPAN